MIIGLRQLQASYPQVRGGRKLLRD